MNRILGTLIELFLSVLGMLTETDADTARGTAESHSADLTMPGWQSRGAGAHVQQVDFQTWPGVPQHVVPGSRDWGWLGV